MTVSELPKDKKDKLCFLPRAAPQWREGQMHVLYTDNADQGAKSGTCSSGSVKTPAACPEALGHAHTGRKQVEDSVGPRAQSH